MAVSFKTIFTGITNFIRARLLWVAIAAVFGFLLGYWISSRTGHWMLVNSTSDGSTQTLGIFQTKRRCSRFMETHKKQIKKDFRLDEEAKTSSEEEKEILSSLEREGIIVYQSRGELSWVTVSCVRLNDGFLGGLLSGIESNVDDLKSRIEDIESR